MKTGLPFGLVAENSEDISAGARCLYCAIIVSRSGTAIEDHVRSARHRKNERISQENGLRCGEDGLLHCKPCGTTLPNDSSATTHVSIDSHTTWIAAMEDLADGEFLDLTTFLDPDHEGNDMPCEACRCGVPSSLASVQNHVNSPVHRENVLTKLKPLNAIFDLEGNEEVWCKICDEYIENDPESIYFHIDEAENHSDWLAQVEDLVADHDIDIENYLAYQHEDRAYCNKCNIHIPCNLKSLEDHIITETHLNTFS